MTDTIFEPAAFYRRMLMEHSPEKRFLMGVRMRAVRRASAGQDKPYLRILRRFVPE